MLALSLEALSKSRLPDNLTVNIYADNSADLDSVEYVRDQYYPLADIYHAKPHLCAPSGCWNILNSIKQGYETGAEHIFFIEEDVLIRSNFFEWHLTQTDHLASCGRKDCGHFPIYGSLYTNPGSRLSRRLVEQIIPHINDDYFTRLRDYLDEHFGPWDSQSALDDGLIRRIIRQMGGQAVYPETPVCAHQGFRLYNKIDLYMNYETDIEKRIARLREILRSIRPGDRYARDFELF